MPAYKCECKFHDCKTMISTSWIPSLNSLPIICERCCQQNHTKESEDQADRFLHNRKFPNGREPVNF